jgi:hypothetical protein
MTMRHLAGSLVIFGSLSVEQLRGLTTRLLYRWGAARAPSSGASLRENHRALCSSECVGEKVIDENA